MYYILGQFFAAIIMLGTPFIFGIMFGRYLSRFASWEEFKRDRKSVV